MCKRCGEGWRFETVELGGPNSGRVKAVLHPINAKWETLYSRVSGGSLLLATKDPAPEDIWSGSTGLYISQVMPDGSRRCRFPGWIPKNNGAGGGATTVAFESIDGFLKKRLVAGPNDPWGITVGGGVLRVVKPLTPTTVTTIYSVPFAGTQAEFAAFLVKLAQGNLVGDGVTGVGSLTATVDLPNATAYDQSINWWDFKNIAQAIEELVAAENGVKYWLEPTFSNGYWSTEMHFSDAIGTAQNYTILSDREAVEYALEVDAEDKATRVYGIGGGQEGNTQFSIAYDADQTDNLPEHQVTVAWKDQTVPDKIDALTRGYVTDHRDPVTVPSFTLLGLPNYDPNSEDYNPQQGFPGPEILQPGDTFLASIGYGVITVRDLLVRCLGVAWSLDDGKPAERVVATQPVIRANQSVRTQVPSKPPAPEQPVANTQNQGNPVTVTPWPVKGLVSNVSVGSLTEISGMETSARTPGDVFLFNDEVNERQIRRVKATTGAQTASFKLSPGLPASKGDPEAIRLSRSTGFMALADTGDNDLDRPTSGANQPALFRFAEPRGGSQTINCDRLPIKYPNSEKVNVECLLIHPKTDEVYLVSKEDDRARVFSYGQLPDMSTSNNTGVLVATMSLKLVSDGTHTWDGTNILFRCAGVSDTQVRKGSTFGKNGTIPTPAMKKSEAIAVESTCSFLTTTEGANAPIYRVLIGKEYGAKCGTTAGPTGTGSGSGQTPAKTPGQVLDLSNWKITLPVGSGNKPKEVTKLATYELKPYFYTDDGSTVVFQAPVDGVTTSGSSYPRSELRQMSGGDEVSWSNKNQTWTMEAELAFTHLPGTKPHAVGLQVHDSNDDVTVLRLEGNDLYVTRGDDTHFDLIDGSYNLGDRMRVKVVAKKGGGIDWYLNGVKVATVPGVYSGCYFKAGVYPQANEDNGTGYGQTKFYSLKVSHS